jgi:hypothetical protein
MRKTHKISRRDKCDEGHAKTGNANWSPVYPVYCLKWVSKCYCMKYRNMTSLIQWVVRQKCVDSVLGDENTERPHTRGTVRGDDDDDDSDVMCHVVRHPRCVFVN